MTLLEAERRRHGWSQTALAFYSQTTQGEISKFERRQAVPRPPQAERLARALGVPASMLLRDVRDPAEPTDAAEASRG